MFQSLSSSPGTFSLFISFSPYISWYSNIDDYPLSLFFVNYNYVLVFLPLSHCYTEGCYPTTLSLLYFLLMLLGCVFTIFLCVLTHSSHKDPNGLSLLHFCVISYILSEPISCIHLLSVVLPPLLPT